MALSMAGRPDTSVPRGVAIIGGTTAAIQAAFTLAQMGVEVQFITSEMSLGGVSSGLSSKDPRYLWPLLLRMASHPGVTIYSGAEIESIKGGRGSFKIAAMQRPRYVRTDLCTSCGRCQAECSSKISSLFGDQKITHTSIHAPLLATKAVPSAYVIDKNGFAPCHVACPLGINVQGFISLLANGKTDQALALINKTAPFAATLGRVCPHPCELGCNRGKLDSPVFIRALHRYAADNAPGGVTYRRKSATNSHQERIAIVGAGPAGLTAAWELARRGYSPVVFEAHGVIGGMLATGIPRFRLPKEVREREIEAIKAMGVDIRTGITVGRDVTFAYLKERGYRAFFLGIGAHQNHRLNIPGEEIEGVVDCISLLLTLNLMRDTFVGQNIVVIGDGNSAIDSARAAIRRNQGTVKILSWTIPEEVTASEEGVEEARQEGVTIEYCAVPVEILGDGHNVVGVRCRRTRLSEELMPNGQHRPVPIPGTDFIIEADHVVVAVGQSPNTPELNIEGLVTNSQSGGIQVNPLTLETSVPGVFAGGDCITGPNNVVSAMAAGLRAAESIDRYLSGRDLSEGRTLEPPPTAEVDVKAIEASPSERASMPVIGTQQRMSSFEETTTGLPMEVAQREAQRCLNCALCSQCLECARVCEAGAVFHEDSMKRFELGAQVVIEFHDHSASVDKVSTGEAVEGFHNIHFGDGGLTDEVDEGMAAALQAVAELRQMGAWKSRDREIAEKGAVTDKLRPSRQPGDGARIGVFLCRCGGSIDSTIDFGRLTMRLSGREEVACVREVDGACNETGASQVASYVKEERLGGAVLAACRCCDLEQVCYSCTDRRQSCQQRVKEYLGLDSSIVLEFVNIREHCAWTYKDNPESATRNALEVISSGVASAQHRLVMILERKSSLPSALVIGGGTASIIAARMLASLGYHVEMVARKSKKGQRRGMRSTVKGVLARPWPDALELRDSSGNYEAVLRYDGQPQCLTAGAVLVEVASLGEGAGVSGLLERVVSHARSADRPGNDILWETTLEGASGLFMLNADGAEPHAAEVKGLVAAARVSAYLEKGVVGPRAMSVAIDRKMCRGCGDCVAICPYIELKEYVPGKISAYVHEGLCLGCGACVAVCPSGAIMQPRQSDEQIVAALRSVLRPEVPSEVGEFEVVF